MADLSDIIKDNFNKGYFNKAMEIEGLSPDFSAWTIKSDNWFGVAVPYSGRFKFSEHFSGVTIKTESDVEIDGRLVNLIMLICSEMSLRDEFSLICSQFVEPGENGNNRKQLVNDPEIWWKRWKGLLGNISSDKEAYGVLGELITLEYFIKKGYNPVWMGLKSATNDIEMGNNYSAEVKSTISRYGYEITVSSIYQLRRMQKKLDLVFCRFEKNSSGQSINDVVSRLAKVGYNSFELENELKKCGLESGCTARKITYKLLEMKKYSVDESFPSVTESSFKNDCLPPHIVKFTYDIDLSGIVCENLLK